MSRRTKELLELVEWSADAALEGSATDQAPTLPGVLAFGALAASIGFETAERMVIDELTERLLDLPEAV